MPTFVDYAGMNTLVSSSIEGNTISSGKNASYTAEEIDAVDELVGINIHRNGPYGYSSWNQLRASENPITRYHNKNSTMTFVVQPGPVRNVLPTGELRVRDRYSALYTFTEPAIAQKAYPLIWNVGRHFKTTGIPIGGDRDDNLMKFSIISSYANQGIGFANDEVDKFHKFDPDEEKTEYREIYKLYAENGLNDQQSPLTYWEFLQYRETVYPHMKNQFQNENLERPTFESFFRHNRADRTRTVATSSFGFEPVKNSVSPDPETDFLSQSTWPLDEHSLFLIRSYNNDSDSIQFDGNGETSYPGDASFQRMGEGSLMATVNPYDSDLGSWQGTGTGKLNSANITHVTTAANAIDRALGPGPLYMRRISLKNTASVSNPSGMVIPQTGGLPNNKLFQGGALWEAGSTRQVKDADGNYISAPKEPSYDTYEHYIEEARRRYKNFSVVPEFRMSTQVEDYLTNGTAIELDMFDVTGGAEDAQNSSQSKFYEIYSNSDFMRQFELINEDHKDMANGKVLSLRCKAVKKFLPYEGFYPAQRTVDLAKRFYDSFKNNISLFNQANPPVQLNDFNYGRQMVMTPLFAPGILLNTIKSGVAVDYPIMTGSMDVAEVTVSGETEYFIKNQNFDTRIPFEALLEPKDYLSTLTLTSNEPHPSGNLSASAIWDGEGDELYSKMANNFLAEVPEFFLPNGNFTSIVSKKQNDGFVLESGKVYGMRVFMAKSYDNPRFFVHHSGASSLAYPPPQDIIRTGSDGFRESFTMYSRPSAFGPPTRGITDFVLGGDMFLFDQSRFILHGNLNGGDLEAQSTNGYNYPFTPPYYHGEAWCDMWITGSGNFLTIEQLQSRITSSFTRHDSSFVSTGGGAIGTTNIGPQAFPNLNNNAVQLSASLNIFGIGKTSERNPNQLIDQLIVDTALDQDARWVIQTKFETPMLNFNHISEANGNLSVPLYGSESVPRGMWHQYGRIPEENEGISIGIKPINPNWQTKVMGRTEQMENLAEVLGFSGVSTKIGRIRSSKKIHEAVVAVPFIDVAGRKKFFSITRGFVQKFKAGGEVRASLTSGDPQNQIGRSVLNQLEKMEKYIFPPSFDFLNNSVDDVEPIAMYIFEFSHTLKQQDLADIWQNLPPDIGTTMEQAEVAITHPLLKKELLGEGGLQSGNTLIDMPNKLKWMVFKVKQRAASNYFKKTVLRNQQVNADVESGDVTQDEFGSTSNIQYNWPYDFFSLVELVKIDAEVELGNFSDEDIANYTDSIPPFEGQYADPEKIEYLIGGMDDDITPDNQVEDESTGIPVGSDAPGGPPTSRIARLIEKSKSLVAVKLSGNPSYTFAQAIEATKNDLFTSSSGWDPSGQDIQFYLASKPWQDWWEEYESANQDSRKATIGNTGYRTNSLGQPQGGQQGPGGFNPAIPGGTVSYTPGSSQGFNPDNDGATAGNQSGNQQSQGSGGFGSGATGDSGLEDE